MSHPLISLSADLSRLQDEGYDLEVWCDPPHLLIHRVPYVNADREVCAGVLVSTLTTAGDVTTAPDTHVVSFIGDMPCDQFGEPLMQMHHTTGDQVLAAGLTVNHTFSSKPPGSDGYPDYYAKTVAYVNMIQAHAQALDDRVTARVNPVVPREGDDDSVFHYMDSASSRAGIGAISKRLQLDAIAIVGLGGTGSYVLDLVAKTWVRQIHLIDGDEFLTHNAFRAPGAPPIETLRTKTLKVDYLAGIYSAMHKGIVPHAEYLDESTVELLRDVDFAFLCFDDGETKRLAVELLEDCGTPFIDVGIGVVEGAGALMGQVRVTTSTNDSRETARQKVSFAGRPPGVVDDYERNIQIADLNALNATLAVIRWKKLFGFYFGPDQEFNSIYTISGNRLLNDGPDDEA